MTHDNRGTETSGVSKGNTEALDRRRVLRGLGLGAGVAALGVGGVGTVAGATTSVSGGSDELQKAIDGAADGDTLVVTDGATYDPVTVEVGVTLEADGNPTIVGDGGTAAVSIEADDVTIRGFTVTNPDGLLGIKVGRGYDGATIEHNTVEDVGPTGSLGVTGIIVGQGDHDDISIVNNVIRNLDQETTEDSGFPTVNGILFDAKNSDPGTLTETTVNNNTIRGIESDVAPLGIVIQQKTDGVTVNNNEISDLTAADKTDSEPSDGVDFGFTFAQGINIASPATADTVINHNVIEHISSEEVIFAEAVKIDGDGSGLTFRANQFLVAVGLNNRNGTADGGRDPSNDPEVDAKNNWWGSEDGPEEAAFNQDADDDDRSDVVGNVRFEPFLRNPPGPKGGGNGQGGGGGNRGNGPGGSNAKGGR